MLILLAVVTLIHLCSLILGDTLISIGSLKIESVEQFCTFDLLMVETPDLLASSVTSR